MRITAECHRDDTCLSRTLQQLEYHRRNSNFGCKYKYGNCHMGSLHTIAGNTYRYGNHRRHRMPANYFRLFRYHLPASDTDHNRSSVGMQHINRECLFHGGRHEQLHMDNRRRIHYIRRRYRQSNGDSYLEFRRNPMDPGKLYQRHGMPWLSGKNANNHSEPATQSCNHRRSGAEL